MGFAPTRVDWPSPPACEAVAQRPWKTSSRWQPHPHRTPRAAGLPVFSSAVHCISRTCANIYAKPRKAAVLQLGGGTLPRPRSGRTAANPGMLSMGFNLGMAGGAVDVRSHGDDGKPYHKWQPHLHPTPHGATRPAFRQVIHRHGAGRGAGARARDLPGRPDLVLRARRVAIFVDGDFWHGWRFPAWRNKLSEKWELKIAANRRRDALNHARLRRSGWLVVRIWEHQLDIDPKRVAAKLQALLVPAQLGDLFVMRWPGHRRGFC
jgi:DNA mismatch endonuclease, patch repair protein